MFPFTPALGVLFGQTPPVEDPTSLTTGLKLASAIAGVGVPVAM